MPKPKRGKNAKRMENWRETCPMCKRQRVRVLYVAINEGQTLKVCKKCGD